MFLETGVFAGREADYLYFLLLSATLINALNYFAELAVLWEALSMVIVYVWSRHNAEVVVNFMFGFRFPAKFLPLVLGTMEFLLAGDLYGPLVGIVTGHAYYFLSEIYVAKDPSWRRRLAAPGWLKGMVPKPQIQTGPQKGFTVQAPYGGRGDPSKQADVKPEGYRPFAGKSQKLGDS
ncbi:Derlin [Paramicrosporidium saccamoebae]|uniref:Derlin n=1 Tax=Paramicrosporidium saccamoebae TaxID=1246581 RepID=A0A2H9TN59_9FUNG|nr:Derlin [Paramicrosporidium saccamoebae]